MPERRYRVLAVATHPAQYMTPIFRRVANHPSRDLHVSYYESQRRVFKWIPNIPGVVSDEVQRLSQALILEIGVQAAMRGCNGPFRTAFEAAVLNAKLVQRDAVADCFPLPADLGLGVDGALMLNTARHGLVYLSDKLSACRYHRNNGFVSQPGSMEFQSRLYKLAPKIPGVTATRDRRLLQALTLEIEAYAAAHQRKDPVGGTCDAVLLVPTLIRPGLVPH